VAEGQRPKRKGLGPRGQRTDKSIPTKKLAIQYNRILALLEELKEESRYLSRLMVKDNGRFLLIETEKIDWIEAQGNYVRVHSGHTQYSLRRRIGYLDSSLDPQVFLRVSRSAIVNIGRVLELQPLSHGDLRLVLDLGIELTLSRNYRRNFERLLGEQE